MSDYVLVYFLGGQKAEITYLDSATIKIGRSADNDVIVSEKYKFVSRYHAAFLLKDDMPHVRDISTNGTWVNCEKLDKFKERELHHKDTIGLVPHDAPYYEELILTFIDRSQAYLANT
tara:strand:- start:6014 stop:6367 length:354 start_codon:yes stop_codon:yes gene_type:complete